MIDRTCRHAHALVTRIGTLPGAELVWEPQINQGLVRFLDPNPTATEADHDRRTDEVIAAILETGEAFFGGTTWRGKRCMRVSVSSWQTSEADSGAGGGGGWGGAEAARLTKIERVSDRVVQPSETAEVLVLLG